MDIQFKLYNFDVKGYSISFCLNLNKIYKLLKYHIQTFGATFHALFCPRELKKAIADYIHMAVVLAC